MGIPLIGIPLGGSSCCNVNKPATDRPARPRPSYAQADREVDRSPRKRGTLTPERYGVLFHMRGSNVNLIGLPILMRPKSA